jgi:hypothetical protein
VFEARRYQVTDNLIVMREKHRLRFGFDLNLTPRAQKRESNIQGRYDFSSLANYQAGRISRYRQTLAAFDGGDLFYDASQREMRFLRPGPGHLRVGHRRRRACAGTGSGTRSRPKPNPAVPETAGSRTTSRCGSRGFGLAWSPGGRGRSLFRATAGIYSARTPANLFQRVFTDNGITTVALDSRVDPSHLDYLTFPNALGSLPPGVRFAPPQVVGFDPSFQNPRAKQFSAGVEHQIGRAVAASLDYVHVSTDQLQRRLDRNLFAPTIDATGMPIFPRTRPNPRSGPSPSTSRRRSPATTRW